MSLDERPKLIYIARRHPRYARESFTRRWREHAALGMSQARWRNVALYLHCDAVDGLLPEGSDVVDCDGVAVVVYRSEAARQAHIADESARRIMKADELLTFEQPVAQTSLLSRAEVRCPAHREGFRLFVFWSSERDGLNAAREAEPGSWPLTLKAGEIGHLRNYVTSALGEWRSACVDEFTCELLDPLRELAGRLQRAVASSPMRPRYVMTRTVVLHDNKPLAPDQA